MTVYSGGAVCLLSSDGTLDYKRSWRGNVSRGRGGGVHMYQSHVVMRGNVLDGNVVLEGDGGGLFAMGGTLTMINTSVLNNVASGEGGGGFRSQTYNPAHLATTLAKTAASAPTWRLAPPGSPTPSSTASTLGVWQRRAAGMTMTQTLWDNV